MDISSSVHSLNMKNLKRALLKSFERLTNKKSEEKSSNNNNDINVKSKLLKKVG